jgi:hypothetical protein
MITPHPGKGSRPTTAVDAPVSQPARRCSSWGCRSDVAVAPLHGGKGGPLLCLEHRLRWDQDDKRQRQRKIDVVEALRFKTDGLRRDEFCYLTKETLEDAIFLCHPDRHSGELQKVATRATAELLALRPYTRPRPERKPSPVTDNNGSATKHEISVTRLKPKFCESCFLTTPFYYCDDCRKIWEEGQRREMDKRNAADRQRRRRKRFRELGLRKCASCGSEFDGRKDARFCSNKCRQRQHRLRRHNRRAPRLKCLPTVANDGTETFR